MKKTQIILRVKSHKNELDPNKNIGELPDISGRNVFVILSRISSEQENDESKEFYTNADTIEQIARQVSSLQLRSFRSDMVIHCFNDAPDHVAKI